MMSNQILKLSKILHDSEIIIITSHLGADPDAICSSLLLSKTLQLNYPDKKIRVALEELSYGLDFIDGFKDVMQTPLDKAVEGLKPDLLIVLDANNLPRVTKSPESLKTALGSAKLAIIDHHEPINVENADAYIHHDSPAVTLDVYDICFNQLGLKKPKNYAPIAMTGIYSDTAGLLHLGKNHTRTLQIVEELINDGADIELINSELHKYSSESIDVLSELLRNISSYKGFTYSYLGDAYIDSNTKNAIRQGIDIFTHEYSRNIDGRLSGFVVYKDPAGEDTDYRVSMRSFPGKVDVSKITKTLGGGGHKPAAGARFSADNLDEALSIVKKAISEK